MKETILAIIVNRAKDKKIKKDIIYSGVISPDEYLEFALKNEYLRISTPLENIDNATLKSIKLALKECGLKQAGEKEEIKQRLKEQGNIEVINRIFTESIYKLTDKGEQLLKDKYFAIFFDKYEMAFYPNISLRDVEEKILIEKKDILTAFEELFEIAKSKSEFKMDNILSSEIQFYRELKMWDKYIQKSFLYCYISLSGVMLGNYSESYSKVPEFKIINLRNDLYELNYDNNKLKELYYEGIKGNKLKMKRFTDEEIFNLIMKAIKVGADELNKEIKVENAKVIDIETGRDVEEVRKEQYAKLGLKISADEKNIGIIGKLKNFFGLKE